MGDPSAKVIHQWSPASPRNGPALVPLPSTALVIGSLWEAWLLRLWQIQRIAIETTYQLYFSHSRRTKRQIFITAMGT